MPVRVGPLQQLVFPIMPPAGGGGGGGGGSGTLLTTITLQNTSGSATGTNFIAPMFGHVFKDGDVNISAGTPEYPKLDIAGVDLPYTATPWSTWPSGYLKHMGFMPAAIPNSIAGSGSVTVNIRNGGTAPASSARSISDLTARDFKVSLAGITGLTAGPWTSTVNQGVTDNDDHKIIASGPGGIIGRTRQQFMSGGAGTEHLQLECYHYWQIIQNSAGGVAFFRYLPMIAQPWMDIDTPTKAIRDFIATFKDGATTLTTSTNGAAQSVTSSSGSAIWTLTNHGLALGAPVRLIGGTAPTNFALNTTYYVVDGNYGTNTFSLGTSVFNDGGSDNTPITAGNAQTTTITPHTEIAHFGMSFGANTDGKWLFIQGGGSIAAESTTRWVFNQPYWKSTGLLPSYDTSIAGTMADASAVTFRPNNRANLRYLQDGTGGDPSIGILPGWCANHFIKQTAAGETKVRVNALAMSCAPFMVKRQSTNTIVVLNNGPDDVGGTYSGMGASKPGVFYGIAGGTYALDTYASPPTPNRVTYTGSQGSHSTQPMYYAYLITAEPQYVDMLIAHGNLAVATRYPQGTNRQPLVGSTQYYGTSFMDINQTRTDAWCSRDLALANAVTPVLYWENTSIKGYQGKMVDDGYASVNAQIALNGSFWTTNGFYHFSVEDNSGTGGNSMVENPWQQHYLLASVALQYGVNKKAAALTLLNHLVKWPNAVDADVGLYMWSMYRCLVSTGPANTAPNVTAMNQIHWNDSGNPQVAINYVGSNRLSFTFNPGDACFALADGDTIRWMFSTGAPTGLSTFVTYFMVNVVDSGPTATKTFQLSATQGGSVLTITDASSTSGMAYCFRATHAAVPSTTWGMDTKTDPEGQVAGSPGSILFAKAAGATMAVGLDTKALALLANAGTDYSGESAGKWKMTASL